MIRRPGHLADNLSDTTNEAFIPNDYPLLNHHMRSARYTSELLTAKVGGIDATPRHRQPGARSIFKVAATVASAAAVGGM